MLEEQKVDDVEHDEQESSPAMPVPQLKIGPDGQVILDPKSLVSTCCLYCNDVLAHILNLYN